MERMLRDEHDPRPFEALVRRHQGFVLTNCRLISRSPADAEDLAQEVFVKAYFGLARFEQRAQFRTWLRRIKVNHCLNFVFKKRGTQTVDVDEPSVASDAGLATPPMAEDRLHAMDQRQRIVAVLDAMSDTLRVPLMLCDADGFSYEEIAEQLGIGLSAVKMRIKRAREEFRQRWAAVDPDAPFPDGPVAGRT